MSNVDSYRLSSFEHTHFCNRYLGWKVIFWSNCRGWFLCQKLFLGGLLFNNFVLYFNAGSTSGAGALTIGAWGFGVSAAVATAMLM